MKMTRVLALFGLLLLMACGHTKPAATNDPQDQGLKASSPAFDEAKEAFKAADDKEGKAAAKARIEAQCSDGLGVACTWLGKQRYTAGRNDESDRKAVAYFIQACEASDGEGCLALGLSHEFGTGSVKDLTKAVDRYGQSCRSGYPDGCGALGIMYINALGVSRDVARGLTILEDACRRGAYGYCLQLGFVHDYNEHVTKDRAQARAFYKRSCDGGHQKGCVALADSLRSLPKEQSNPERIIRLYQGACQDSVGRACTGLGQCFSQGIGVAKNESKALDAYIKACQLKHAYGCWQVGNLFEKRPEAKDQERARLSFQRGCRFKSARACNRLGIMLDNDKERPTIDSAKAYWEGCTLGSHYACRNLGYLLLKKPSMTYNLNALAEALRKQCKNDELASCNVLGQLQIQGRLGAEAQTKGRTLLEGHCKGEEFSGCPALAEAYEAGHGVSAKDPKKAANLRHLACAKLGYMENTCRELPFKAQAWKLTVSSSDKEAPRNCVLRVPKYYEGSLCEAAITCDNAFLYGGPSGDQSWIYCTLSKRGKLLHADDPIPASEDNDPILNINVKKRQVQWENDGRTLKFKMKKTRYPEPL